MKINIKRLIEVCEYDPNRIGIALLKALGFRVKKFSDCYDCNVYVYDKKNRLKFWG